MSRRRRWLRPIAVVLTIATLAGGAVALSFAPVFDAEQVLVRGTVHLRPREVRRIAALSVGTNVLHADLHAAVRRLRRNGWIAGASARRDLPATIVVQIHERVPVGTIAGDGRAPALVMHDGTVVPGAWRTRLPKIFMRGAGGGAASLEAVAEALGTLSEEVRRQVSAASLRPGGWLVLQLRRGVAVHYGPPVDLGPKAQAVKELLRWADDHAVRLTVLDVTVPQAPTARTVRGDVDL